MNWYSYYDGKVDCLEYVLGLLDELYEQGNVSDDNIRYLLNLLVETKEFYIRTRDLECKSMENTYER